MYVFASNKDIYTLRIVHMYNSTWRWRTGLERWSCKLKVIGVRITAVTDLSSKKKVVAPLLPNAR